MNSFSIRPVRDKDGPKLAELIASIFSEYDGCIYEPSEYPMFLAPKQYYEKKSGWFFVVDTPTGVAQGCIAAEPTILPTTFELKCFYLANALRGSGVAEDLLATILALLLSYNAQHIRLWSDIRFHRAHRFYEKHGFQKIPGMRFLLDASDSWEYGFRLNLSSLPAD